MSDRRMSGRRMRLRPGDWVEIRPFAEILPTLDERGELEAMPFMPEMAPFVGRRFQVSARAHKTCDRVWKSGLRRLDSAVHLDDLRCDGAAHGNCQAACLLFWKDAWLHPADGPGTAATNAATPAATMAAAPASSPAVPELLSRSTTNGALPDGEIRWSCQATEMGRATRPLRAWDIGHYLTDVRLGQARLADVLGWGVTWLLTRLQHLPVRGAWRFFEAIRGPFRIPSVAGTLDKTPKEELHLQAGEVVEVRPHAEILTTLDRRGRNRGLTFDPEMVPYCGGRYPVRSRVERIIDEPTGRLMRLPNDCIILEGTVCQARWHGFCRRAIFPYWREIWLRRVAGPEKDRS